MRSPFICLALLLAVCLGGCHKRSDDRLLGKWTFDRDYTLAHLPKEAVKAPDASPAPSVSPKGSPSEGAAMAKEINGMLNDTVKPMLNSLKPMLVQQLIGQMDGQTFSITPKLITDSSGKAQTYEVVERANANSWSVKTSDGEIATYTLEDGRIVFPTTGDVHFKTYFKRVDP